MKQTFTLLLAVIISTGIYAAPFFSRLSISSMSGSPLKIMVDGNRYRTDNNSVTINNLQQGYHTVKIYRQQFTNRQGYPGNNYNTDQLIYSSTVYVKPQYHVDITINRFGKAFIDEQPVRSGYYREEENDWNDDWNNSNHNWNNSDWNNRVMNDQSFNRFKESLKNESFDNTRISIAKQVINTNYLNTNQVKELLQLFSFENNKLDLAKYAYKNTVDKQDYYSVADCFSFSSNKEELMRYIQNYR